MSIRASQTQCLLNFTILNRKITNFHLFSPHSDKEATVMLSNSWLYHYYSVQSKIQMGLTYEGSRLPQISNNYYPYQPITPQHFPMHQMHQPPYDLQGHSIHGHHYDYSPPVSNLNHHNDINHNSPTMKETSLAPVDYSQQQMEKLSPAHENGNRETKIDEYSEPSRKKAADDKSNKLTNHDKKLSKVDFKSVRISNKKYTFKRIESLHISDSNPETDELPPRAYDNHSEHIIMETEHRDGQMLYVNSSIHSTRSRISKNFSSSLPALPHNVEPSNEIDQWNPSPTWSENNIQKVPDIMHQQLSPYLITTPPTPMSASYIPHHGSTFTFDWAPEHYVPTVAAMHDERNFMELAPASRCYYNRPMMSIDDNNGHKDDTTIRNS